MEILLQNGPDINIMVRTLPICRNLQILGQASWILLRFSDRKWARVTDFGPGRAEFGPDFLSINCTIKIDRKTHFDFLVCIALSVQINTVFYFHKEPYSSWVSCFLSLSFSLSLSPSLPLFLKDTRTFLSLSSLSLSLPLYLCLSLSLFLTLSSPSSLSLSLSVSVSLSLCLCLCLCLSLSVSLSLSLYLCLSLSFFSLRKNGW